MPTLQTKLNSLFTAPRPPRRQPKDHVIFGVLVTNKNGLWTATVDGKVYRNSKLADLAIQLDEVLA